MKDLFPDKHFSFTEINGVQYISKDVFEQQLSNQKKEIVEKIKDYFDYHILNDILLVTERRILVKCKEKLIRQIEEVEK